MFLLETYLKKNVCYSIVMQFEKYATYVTSECIIHRLYEIFTELLFEKFIWHSQEWQTEAKLDEYFQI